MLNYAYTPAILQSKIIKVMTLTSHYVAARLSPHDYIFRKMRFCLSETYYEYFLGQKVGVVALIINRTLQKNASCTFCVEVYVQLSFSRSLFFFTLIVHIMFCQHQTYFRIKILEHLARVSFRKLSWIKHSYMYKSQRVIPSSR